MAPRVVNVNEENYDVYVGRGSVWGNPFKIGQDGTREEVINKFIDYYNGPSMAALKMRNKIRILKNKVLGCYCYPKKCHGDFLMREAKRLK